MARGASTDLALCHRLEAEATTRLEPFDADSATGQYLEALALATELGMCPHGRRRPALACWTGHSTPTMTIHYISADLDAMRAAVKLWGRAAGRATAESRRGKLRRNLRIRGDA